MRAAGQRIGPQGELALVGWKEQNLLMADRPAQTFGFKVPWAEQLQRGVAWQAARPEQRWLLVQEPALLACIDRQRAEVIGVANRRRWWLVPASAVVAPCVPSPQELTRERREQGNIDVD